MIKPFIVLLVACLLTGCHMSARKPIKKVIIQMPQPPQQKTEEKKPTGKNPWRLFSKDQMDETQFSF